MRSIKKFYSKKFSNKSRIPLKQNFKRDLKFLNKKLQK